ncbi:unnamed protein product [Arctia plantaginis]|uniref:LEM domain-containing protein n=1 Tax=Arctia plantaginis TaxID=874455 RepID=A0A8S1A1J8_ARCPL|nr:unnamed protein product [Arctia plantaginis]
MGHQFDSMSDAQLQAKLAAAGFPVLPITATTRPLLMKKLQSGLVSKNCQETPKYYTMVDRVYSMSDVELQKALVEFGYRIMPVTATTRKVLLKKLISIYDGTSTARKTAANNSSKEFCFNPSTLSRPDYKFAPNLSSLKSSVSEADINIFGIDRKTTTEQFRPSFEPEANKNPLLYNNDTPATLDQLPSRTKDCNMRNMDDYEKNIIDMFQTFSSQQDKRFREMLTNINTTRQDMFQNLSNQQEVRFRELLTDLNCARQEIYQTVSIQQEKCFKELLTNLNSTRQNMFQELSNQQDKRFNDLIASLQSTKDDVCQLLYDQREKQFEELLSNVNRIKVEKAILTKLLIIYRQNTTKYFSDYKKQMLKKEMVRKTFRDYKRSWIY